MIDYYPDDLDTPEKVHNELIRLYSNNVKRFEMVGVPILCCKCSAIISKSDYVQNYGYCSTCHKLVVNSATIFNFVHKKD